MWHQGLIRSLTFSIFLLALTSGCSFHGYRPVAIEARDAETGKPIAGANVRISYPLTDSPFAPSEAFGKTAADGIVHLKAAPTGEIGVKVTSTTKGYMDEEQTVSVDAVQAIKPAGWFEAVDKRPPTIVLSMYSEPRPTVELIVPPTFRGLIKAEIDANADGHTETGQRAFRAAVPDSGTVRLNGSPLLERLLPLAFSFKFADGSPLSLDATASTIGYWWLRREGTAQVFFVGTKEEFAKHNPAPTHSADGSDHGSGRSSGRGSGRGRRHGGGGGGQSSGDAS
jgi:hypothetical protein